VLLNQTADGGPALDVRLERETIWLDAHKMAESFGRNRTVIVRRIHNVYATGEPRWEATCAKNAQVAADGKRIADNALVAMTPLIAESRPEEKDMLTRVVMSLINRRNA
jgi:hypothetical protein